MKAKTDLSKYNNSWYKPGDPVKRFFWYFTNVVFFLNPFFPISAFKVFLLKLFGAQVGKNVVIKPGVSIKYPWKLKIGNHVWIGENAWIDNLAQVTIENNCCISQGAYLLCGNHHYKKTTFDLIVRDIKLEEGAWVGAKAIVCPGVVCRTHSVLSAGSVATSSLEEYSIYTGNPAVKIRDRVIE